MKTASTSKKSKVQSPKSAVCSLPPSPRLRRTCQSAVSPKAGFTLIEILVVVAVILLLSGMLYRIGDLVDSRAKRAETVARMQKLANALEEYNVVYGVYPNPPDAYTVTVITNNMPERVLEMSYEQRKELGIKFGEKIGLVSYLVTEKLPFKTNAPSEFICWDSVPPPNMPDKATRGRWSEFISVKDLVGTPDGWNVGEDGVIISIIGVDLPFYPTGLAFKDSWGKDLVYASKFPNLSYTLFSKGPDKRPNTEDDVSVSSSGQ